MNNCNWTAGPWFVDQNAWHTLYVTNNKEEICELQTHIDADMDDSDQDWVTINEQSANAHLIAAAPELYDLLQQCKSMGLLTIGYDSGADHKRLCAEADRIMAKARGETA